MFALPIVTVIAALAGYAAAESHQVTVGPISTHSSLLRFTVMLQY